MVYRPTVKLPLCLQFCITNLNILSSVVFFLLIFSAHSNYAQVIIDLDDINHRKGINTSEQQEVNNNIYKENSVHQLKKGVQIQTSFQANFIEITNPLEEEVFFNCYSMSGTLIKRGTSRSKLILVDIPNLPRQMYILRIVSLRENISKKLVL